MKQSHVRQCLAAINKASISAGRLFIKRLFRPSSSKSIPHPRLERAGLWYLRLVPKSCRIIVSPAAIPDLVDHYWPGIITTWHGQAYILPFALHLNRKVQVLVSGSPDGQIFARTVTQLGYDVIVGSGSGLSPKDMIRKRGLAAFENMLNALKENYAVASTADVPKVAGTCGFGIIKLARHSGRPIVPVAVMTSHRLVIPTWDSTVCNLPFGRLAIVVGDPIYVDDTDDDVYLERKRIEVETTLNAVNAKARELAIYWRTQKRSRLT